MDNQHRHINGYRELNLTEINLINEIKEEGERLCALVNKVCERLHAQAANAEVVGNFAELMRLENADPGKWWQVGKENLQAGLMALTRSVAQPTTF